MAGEPRAGAPWEALVHEHGPGLHRTALMLAGDPDRADALLAAVVAAAGTAPPAPDSLYAALARAHVRTARGRRDQLVVRDRTGDVGDLLQDLPARLRAAAVLHLGTGWSPGRAAGAVRVRQGRLRELVGTVPELGPAVRAVADRWARPDSEVVADLLAAVAAVQPGAAVPPTGTTSTTGTTGTLGTTKTTGTTSTAGTTSTTGTAGDGRVAAYLRGRRSRPVRWVAVVAVLAAALGAGLLGARPEQPAEVPPPTAATQTSLADRGWVLDPEGRPPRAPDGLRLSHVATIDYADRDEPLSLPAAGGEARSARWAALWCDLPPVDDDHLEVPRLTLTLREGTATVPCAGRTGTPALTALTALPLGVEPSVRVAWAGDLPGIGTATLALYTEDGEWAPGVTEGVTPAPPVADGAVSVDADDLAATWWGGPVHTALLEVGHDSVLTAWAGSSAALTLLVDGINLTDDGDMRAWMSGPGPSAWRTQDPQLRDGRWFVRTPDQVRVFALPEEVRPAAGQRRTVAVTVVVSGQTDRTDETGRPLHLPRWQVQVSDSTRSVPDDEVEPLRAGLPGGVDRSRGPLRVAGFGLVGHWTVPADGMEHRVGRPEGDLPYLVAVAPLEAPEEMPFFDPYSVGIVRSDQGEVAMVPGASAQELLAWGPGLWDGLPDSGPRPPPGELTVRLPAAPGHPDTVVLAYLPVPYEEFDVAGAPGPTESWPAGSPSPYGPPGQGGPRILAEGVRGEDGRVTFDTRLGPSPMLQVTTQGKGRLRVLVDGVPQPQLAPAHDGWWSSWTDEHVTSVVPLDLVLSPGNGSPAQELVLEVEGWEEAFDVAALAW